MLSKRRPVFWAILLTDCIHFDLHNSCDHWVAVTALFRDWLSYRTIAAFFAIRKTPNIRTLDCDAADPDLRFLQDVAKDPNDPESWPSCRGSIEA
jgi:hypothetical protein